MESSFSVRPLTRNDGRAAGLLTEEVLHEFGAEPMHSAEATERLFTTPWLEKGAGLVLEHSGEFVGYGWARASVWNGHRYVHVGLFLRKPFRTGESHRLLTEPLLELAVNVARKYHITDAVAFYRSIDLAHPSILRELGFCEHPVRMIGFRNDLKTIPDCPLPEGVRVRILKWPAEKQLFISLTQQVFDDRKQQGEPLHPDSLDFELTKPEFNPEQFLVVERLGKPVGYAILFAAREAQHLLYEFAELGVVPELRHQGLGRALLSQGLNWIKGQGAAAALIAVFSTNHSARLYWRLGFRPDPARTFNFFIRQLLPAG